MRVHQIAGHADGDVAGGLVARPKHGRSAPRWRLLQVSALAEPASQAEPAVVIVLLGVPSLGGADQAFGVVGLSDGPPAAEDIPLAGAVLVAERVGSPEALEGLGVFGLGGSLCRSRLRINRGFCRRQERRLGIVGG